MSFPVYPKVTVVTATTGRPELLRCIKSVHEQSYPNIQHLVVADGEVSSDLTQDLLFASCYDVDLINLPVSIGKDRWNGHRIYGAGTYIADGDFVIYLDDDNTLDPDHIQRCYEVYANHFTGRVSSWVYSLRKIVDISGNYLCNDDCESLGNWPSVININDFFIDVNCYFLPKLMAVQISPIWYRKFREPGQPEVDRVLCQVLRSIGTGICTGEYSVNYAVASNAALSVKPEFFIQGNAEMLRRYNGSLPWKK